MDPQKKQKKILLNFYVIWRRRWDETQHDDDNDDVGDVGDDDNDDVGDGDDNEEEEEEA